MRRARAVGRDDGGKVGPAKREALKEPGSVVLDIDVHDLKRVTVARHETLETHEVGAVAVADQENAPLGMANEPDAAQDEGSHDDLADIRLAGNQLAEIGVRHPDETRAGLRQT